MRSHVHSVSSVCIYICIIYTNKTQYISYIYNISIYLSNVGQSSPAPHHAVQLQPQAALGAPPGERR